MSWSRKPRSTAWTELPLLNGWAGQVWLRRTGMTVWVRVVGLDGSAKTSELVCEIPLGFRDAGPDGCRGELHTATSAPVIRRYWAGGGSFRVVSSTQDAPLWGSVSWPTDNAMPTGGA